MEDRMTKYHIYAPSPHVTLAKPKSWFQTHGLHTIDII